MKYDYIIGIDCGKNTGYALWNCNTRQLEVVESYFIHTAIRMVTELHEIYRIFVRVEDARQVKFKTDIYKAQGAGSVKRDATIWEDFLKDLQIMHEMIRPNKSITKWKAAYFNKATGWQASTNEHARDAALLIYKFN